MGKINIVPNASGAGTFTIESPDSGTDRTFTLPDSDGTAVVADGSGNATFTGTVSASSLNLTTGLTVPNGGTGAGTFTTNGLIYGNGTSALAATTAGTSGQVLTSNGSGSAPTFQDASGGGWSVKTALTTVSGVTTIALTDLTKTIKIYIQVTAVQTDGDQLSLQMSTDNGSTYDTGGFDYSRTEFNFAASTGATVSYAFTDLSRIRLAPGIGGFDPSLPAFAEITIFDPQLNSKTQVTSVGVGQTTDSADNPVWFHAGGFRRTASVVNAVRLFVDASFTDTFDAKYFVLESTA